MEYYIYHIQGVKIGMTNSLEKRMSAQRFTEREILETHTCIYEGSRRELELQAEYGYPVDSIPYYKAIENLEKGRGMNNTGFFTKEDCVKGGSMGVGDKRSKESKQKMREAQLGKKQKVLTCPHCNKQGGNAMKMYHFDKCKLNLV